METFFIVIMNLVIYGVILFFAVKIFKRVFRSSPVDNNIYEDEQGFYKICPVCRGSGEITRYGRINSPAITSYKVICHNCRGTGTIDLK